MKGYIMILFEEDWQVEYPHAVIHKETKNESFVRYSALLKSMGVKNYLFPLQLHDPELALVDPYDPNLTEEQMMRVALECYNNFYYFIREVARTPESTDEMPIRFRANRGNMALYWLYLNHVETLLIMIRQSGKSFAVDSLDNYLLNIRLKKMEIHLLTKDDKLRTSNLNRLKKLDESLPFYLRRRNKFDVGNTEKMTVKALQNAYIGHLPAASPKDAIKVGRGMTTANFRIDEFAYFKNIAISLPSALAAGTAARAIAEQLGYPYGTLFTTTAGMIDDEDGKYAYDYMLGCAVWSEMFMEARNYEHLIDIITKAAPNEEREARVNCTFNHRQLGFSDEWLRKAMVTAKSKGEDAERDFLNQWTHGTESSLLSEELNALIRSSEKTDYYNDITTPHNYIVRWFVPQHAISTVMNEDHVMSLDTSDALGNDDIGMKIRKVNTGGITASGNYNEINLFGFAEWVANWLIKYPKLTLIIERRSSGAAIIDGVIRILVANGIDPFRRIFNKVVQEADEKPDQFKEIMVPMNRRPPYIYEKMKSSFGFATAASGMASRSDLYGITFQNAAAQTGGLVHDPMTIKQILGLKVINGRIDHGKGGHDDMVIAWLLSYWMLTQAKNLHYYGINARDILSQNQKYLVANNPQDKYKQLEQAWLREKIEALSEEIKKERDDYVAAKLEANLKAMVIRLSADNRQILSVDEMISNLREQRKLNNRFNHYQRR